MTRASVAVNSLMVCTILSLSMDASAQAICRAYEYAELKDMPKQKLEQMYCDYGRAMREMLDVALKEIQSGHQVSSQRAQNDSVRCSQEQDRVERVLQAQHSAAKPTCSK